MTVDIAIEVLLRSSSSPEQIEEAAQWLRAQLTPLAPSAVAPAGGIDVKCPRCTRLGVIHVEAGRRIGQCAQCWLGEGVHVSFVAVAG